MQFRQINMGGVGPGSGIGCGGLIFVLGLILVSPVGEWLIKGIGWLFILIGVLIIVGAIYLWMRGSRP
ncbi:MAG: hypothetical protein MK099_02350 [Dehalococcoidia bacterium]|jgi:hypothetical protein|nr:hypothetical protein [Dehalococcoidia bacterium]|tara:strand:+ start:1159 stop:1362 length:204 start_codon:yes stop_codon:yes gene_type:complete